MEANSKVELADGESLFDKQIEDKDAEDWVREQTDSKAKVYLATEQKFDELGLTLTEEDNSKIDSQVSMYYNQYVSYYQYDKRGIGEESYRKLVEQSIKQQKIFRCV